MPILPELKGRVDGIAMHGPVPVGFLDDIVFFGMVYMHAGIFLRPILIYPFACNGRFESSTRLMGRGGPLLST